jgi:hypothetical protein
MGNLTVALFRRSANIGLFGLASKCFWHLGVLLWDIVF